MEKVARVQVFYHVSSSIFSQVGLVIEITKAKASCFIAHMKLWRGVVPCKNRKVLHASPCNNELFIKIFSNDEGNDKENVTWK